MATKKASVRPVGPEVIRDIARKLSEEVVSSYVVSSAIEIDWCPCCGINIRMRDTTGKLFAKFIAPTPWIARDIAVDLLAMAQRAAEIADTPAIHQKAQADLIRACKGEPLS